MNLLNIIDFGKDIMKEDLFEGVVLPPSINREQVIQTIIFENWMLTPYITDFNLLKNMIGTFFKNKYNSYDNVQRALTETYNPIHNYDRYEDKDETRNNDRSDIYNGTVASDDEGKVSAFDSSEYQPQTKDIMSRKDDKEEKLTKYFKNPLYYHKSYFLENWGICPF